MGRSSDKHINWINFGAFFGDCLFVCGFTYDEVLFHFKKKKTPMEWVRAFEMTKDTWEEDIPGFVSKRKVNGVTYLFMVMKKRFDFKDDSHNVLAHEVLHLISYHLRDFLDPMEENECFCYTHSHVMRQCYKILRS